MIIDNTSPFRRIPAQTGRKQVLFYDGIRYGSLVSPTIKVLCILASYLFPNGILYFLESGTDIHSS